jgi:hypothetical protein
MAEEQAASDTPARTPPAVQAQPPAGCRNGAELWRRLRVTGFRGSLQVVAEWATRRRRAEGAGRETLRKVPPAPVLSRQVGCCWELAMAVGNAVRFFDPDQCSSTGDGLCLNDISAGRR